MKFNKTVRNAAATLIAAASVFSATSASAQTRVDLDQNLLDTFNTQFVQDEQAFLSNAGQFQVDLNDLIYTGYGDDNALEVYFINEGAGFRNSLSLGVDGSSIQNNVFSDISSTQSVLSEGNGVLDLGQGVSFLPSDLTPEAVFGSAIELTLNANGSSQYVYSTDESQNVDGLQHVVGYNFNDGVDDWLILGFEDLYGELGASGADGSNPGFNNQNSDRDFNDVVIALRGVTTKESVPEPGMMLGLGAAAAVGALRRRKSAK